MPLIKTVDPKEATGKVAGIYEHFTNKFGFVPNAFKLTSSSEFLLQQQVNSLGYYMQHPTISNRLQAFIRMLVSIDKNCEYCVNMNTGLLLNSGLSIEQIETAKKNPAEAPLEPKEIEMLLFVLKVVNNPKAVNEADLNKLRSLGWQDSEIMEASFQGASQVASDTIFEAFKIENDQM